MEYPVISAYNWKRGEKNMIYMNLKRLRNQHQYSQEMLAEKLGVSRQVIAKWEKGDSTPNIDFCVMLADLYNVTLDDLVKYNEEEEGLAIPPKGKHIFGSTTVGERGQIVIPKKAREIFRIETGETLIIAGDEERGLAIIPQNLMQAFFPPNVLLDKEEKE